MPWTQLECFTEDMRNVSLSGKLVKEKSSFKKLLFMHPKELKAEC